MSTISLPALIAIFKHLIEKYGSCTKAAQAIGLSNGYLNDIVHSRKLPGEKALDAVGYTLIPRYKSTRKK